MEKLCAAALAVTMAMGNLTYGAPLANGRASARALSAAKIEGLYQDIMDESGTEELLKDGLVMHSTFDEGSVTAGQITDVTGNGNNGTVVGAPAYEKGIRGNAISLNNGESAGKGNTKAEQYVNYGRTKDLMFGTSDYSLSFWMKTENHGQNNGTILSNKNYLSGSNVGWAFGNYNNSNDTDVRMNFPEYPESGSRSRRYPRMMTSGIT